MRIEAKRTLLRRILAQIALVRQSQLAALPRPLTQQELWMQAIAGITLVALGLIAVAFLASVACIVVGLFNVFDHSGESIFLIVVGFAGAFLSALALK